MRSTERPVLACSEMDDVQSKDLDWNEIRRLAEAAARDLLENRWAEYMDMARRVEALPQNQNGADKSWVERADRAHREQLRVARLVRRASSEPG